MIVLHQPIQRCRTWNRFGKYVTGYSLTAVTVTNSAVSLRRRCRIEVGVFDQAVERTGLWCSGISRLRKRKNLRRQQNCCPRGFVNVLAGLQLAVVLLESSRDPMNTDKICQ